MHATELVELYQIAINFFVMDDECEGVVFSEGNPPSEPLFPYPGLYMPYYLSIFRDQENEL